jgi:hypothetical protein
MENSKMTNFDPASSDNSLTFSSPTIAASLLRQLQADNQQNIIDLNHLSAYKNSLPLVQQAEDNALLLNYALSLAEAYKSLRDVVEQSHCYQIAGKAQIEMGNLLEAQSTLLMALCHAIQAEETITAGGEHGLPGATLAKIAALDAFVDLRELNGETDLAIAILESLIAMANEHKSDEKIQTLSCQYQLRLQQLQQQQNQLDNVFDEIYRDTLSQELSENSSHRA